MHACIGDYGYYKEIDGRVACVRAYLTGSIDRYARHTVQYTPHVDAIMYYNSFVYGLINHSSLEGQCFMRA
jgi:hypothetical protein